jgi:GTPase-activating protein SAC7
LSGSAKRIKDLQTVFDSPERYGKGLDWTGYTVHDAANIFRRYLNQLPEPIVPLDFYERFRDPLRSHQAQAVGDMEAQEKDVGNFDHNNAVTTFQRLITELPPLNRQLLLYVLDLLAVFSSKSDCNRMNSANLAAIFQPGIISHPSHDMAPKEYRLSQDVLIFLIENQDNFLFGMNGTAVDEETVKDMESGPPTMVTPKATMGRSASNASVGADSLRKFGRRNSVSSRHSKASIGAPSPGTPGTPLTNTPSAGGVQRSNTLPTKKSPAIGSARFQRQGEPTIPISSGSTPPLSATGTFAGRLAVQPASSPRAPSSPRASNKEDSKGTGRVMVPETNATLEQKPRLQNMPSNLVVPAASLKSPTRERKISSLFARSPILGPRESDGEQKDGRQPNKLRKKQNLHGSANDSARSSQNSLHADAACNQTFHTPLASPELISHSRPDPLTAFQPASSDSATPTAEAPYGIQHSAAAPPPDASIQDQARNTLQPPRSPEPSIHSRSSFSDFEAGEQAPGKARGHGHRWRFSSSAKKNGESPLVPPPPIGQNTGARGSNSSLGSSHRPRKSLTGESHQTQQTGTDNSSVRQNQLQRSSQESSELLKDSGSEPEKKGLFGKWKAKITQSKEDRKERELEKERARSPQRSEGEHTGSRHSLTAFAQDHLPHRGRSMEQQRESALPSVSETSPGIGTGTMSPVPPTPVTAVRTGADPAKDAAVTTAQGQALFAPPSTTTNSKVHE